MRAGAEIGRAGSGTDQRFSLREAAHILELPETRLRALARAGFLAHLGRWMPLYQDEFAPVVRERVVQSKAGAANAGNAFEPLLDVTVQRGEFFERVGSRRPVDVDEDAPLNREAEILILEVVEAPREHRGSGDEDHGQGHEDAGDERHGRKCLPAPRLAQPIRTPRLSVVSEGQIGSGLVDHHSVDPGADHLGGTDRRWVEEWVAVDNCPLPASTATWTVWSHWWRPSIARRYEIVLKVPDPSVPTRRLDVFYYIRDIDIDLV